MIVTADWRGHLARSRGLALFEMAAVAAVFVADHQHLILLSKTPYLLALGWTSLALRGSSWRELGFRLGPQWRRWLLVGIAAGLGMEMLELFVTQPILVALTGKMPDLSEVAAIKGDATLFAVALALTWTLAAIGEELVWRGYVLNRAAWLLGGGRWGQALALAAMSLAFGLAHAYQGITGVTENALAGLMLGGLYLASGRNLLAPIIAHGITDTVDVTLIFTGHYPGL